MDTNALITIDQLVQGMLLKSDLPEGFYAKMKQMAIDGYRELNMITLPEGRNIAKFTMNSNNIIYMTSDMIEINNVSVPVEGKMWPLTRERKMVPTTTLDNGSEIRDPEEGEGVDLTERGTFYATKGGMNNYGYYRVDDRNRRILFTNVDRSEVMVDYLSSGTNLTEATYIPVKAKLALEAYIRYYLEMNKLNPNPNNVQMFKREYEAQKSILRMIRFNLQDFLDTIYRTFSATINRGDNYGT